MFHLLPADPFLETMAEWESIAGMFICRDYLFFLPGVRCTEDRTSSADGCDLFPGAYSALYERSILCSTLSDGQAYYGVSSDHYYDGHGHACCCDLGVCLPMDIWENVFSAENVADLWGV